MEPIAFALNPLCFGLFLIPLGISSMTPGRNLGTPYLNPGNSSASDKGSVHSAVRLRLLVLSLLMICVIYMTTSRLYRGALNILSSILGPLEDFDPVMDLSTTSPSL